MAKLILGSTRRRAMSSKKSDRFVQILSKLKDQYAVTLSSLSEELGVSAATIRRDLADLEDQGLLVRTHGGAHALGHSTEVPIQLKASQRREAKQLIARCAAGLIPTGRHVLALSGGTTTAELARLISTRADLTVVTNSLTTAQEIVSRPNLRVIMTGGVARPHSFELVGPLSENTFNALNVGTAVLGADGIGLDGVTSFNEIGARTNHAMVSHAQRVIVVADGSKIGKRASAKMADLTEISDLVTDSSASDAELTKIRSAGVRIHLVTLETNDHHDHAFKPSSQLARFVVNQSRPA